MFDDIIRNSVNNLPSYIPGRQVDEVKKEFNIKEVVKLASNENSLGPSPLAIDAIKNKLNYVSMYPDQNSESLRYAVSKKFGVSPHNIIIGNGSDEIMLMIAQTFLSAGDEAIISNNTFSMYEFVTSLMDGKPVFVDLKDYTYDLDNMAQSLTNKTKLIFLCNPNNPTGTMFSNQKLEEFLKIIPKNIIIAIDEAYGEYANDSDFKSAVNLINDFKNIIVLKTFSKIYGLAGLRIGYGIADPALIKYLNLVKLPFNANWLGQLAAEAALRDDEFIRKSIQNNSDGKKYFYEELDNMGLEYLKTQANFIFIKVNNADQIFINLMSQGIIIRPLSSFGFKDSIRVTIGTQRQNELFISSLKNALKNV